MISIDLLAVLVLSQSRSSFFCFLDTLLDHAQFIVSQQSQIHFLTPASQSLPETLSSQAKEAAPEYHILM